MTPLLDTLQGHLPQGLSVADWLSQVLALLAFNAGLWLALLTTRAAEEPFIIPCRSCQDVIPTSRGQFAPLCKTCGGYMTEVITPCHGRLSSSEQGKG